MKKSAISFIDTYTPLKLMIKTPSKIWESSFGSPIWLQNDIGLRFLIIGLSQSKLSDMQ